MDELDVAGPDEHRDDRQPAVDERLRLVGVERRRRDEVVVEPIEPLRQVVEERALHLDPAVECLVQALGVVAGVGIRALGEQDLDEGAGPFALRRRRERSGRDLVGCEARLRPRAGASPRRSRARASAPRFGAAVRDDACPRHDGS